jgi:ribosomal protein S18 acetylase RimI-like enzyme
MSELSFISYKCAEIQAVITDLASLRIAVFREFPYLYNGSFAYEYEYLQTYIKAPKSFLFAVYNNDKMIGATTCIPLLNETAEVQEPFIKAKMDLDKIFYFGESILLPEFRGLGLGNRFFDEREAHAKSFGNYSTTCFCAVKRDENHPLKPANYKPLNQFWIKRGYKKEENLKSNFLWQDIDEAAESQKTMIYWTKNIGNES